jgi:hypothetical protein
LLAIPEFVTKAIAEAAATVRLSLNNIDFGKSYTTTSEGVTKSVQKMFQEAHAKYLSADIV